MPVSILRRLSSQTDWTCDKVIDGKTLSAACDFCGTAIRFIHILEHHEYDHTLEAGCCCAARLCSGYDASDAEREMKNRVNRLMSFTDLSKWHRSQSNPANVWRWVKITGRKKFRVTVFLKDGWYMTFVDSECDWEKFKTQGEAMDSAFELVEEKKCVARRKKSDQKSLLRKLGKRCQSN